MDPSLVKNLRSHALLKHLDYIKPILELDLNYVKWTYDRLLQWKPDDILLNYFDVEVKNMATVFPGQSEILPGLIELFQFDKPNIGKCFIVQDILTIMCILSTGPISDKCSLLFTMYNMNNTGNMDEAEHINFILRTSKCLRTLKLMGTLDITRPDARYMALEARTILVGQEHKFIPVLNLVHFTHWVETNKQVQGLFFFVKVLNRLVDSMIALQRRTDAVLNIMETKAAYKSNAVPVPTLETFLGSCVQSSLPVWLVYRGQTTVSFNLPLQYLDIDEVYIKYDKVVQLTSTLYDIPRSILKRNTDMHQATCDSKLRCCHRTHLVTSYSRASVDSTERRYHQVPYVRVDLHGLDAESSYFITIYTERVRYHTVKVKTLPTPLSCSTTPSRNALQNVTQCSTKKPLKENDQSNDSNEGFEESKSKSIEGKNEDSSSACEGAYSEVRRATDRLTILPSCLSIFEAESFCARDQQQQQEKCVECDPNRFLIRGSGDLDESESAVGSSRTIVFTGTVCRADQAFESSLYLLEDFERHEECYQRVANSLSAAASSQYACNWSARCGVLLGISQCAAPSRYLSELVPSVEQSQVLYYDGAGPWGDKEAQRYMRSCFGEHCFSSIQQKLERAYRVYSSSISPPTYHLHEKSTQLFFVRSMNCADIEKRGNNSCVSKPREESTATLAELTELLMSKLLSTDSLVNAPQHIVILVRSPEDLFETTDHSHTSLLEQLQTAEFPNIAAAAAAEGGCGVGAEKKTGKASAERLTPALGSYTLDAAAKSEKLRKPDGRETQRQQQPPASAVPKLTGRHEILYGEYSQGPSTVPVAQDSSFLGLLREDVEEVEKEAAAASSSSFADSDPGQREEQFDSTLCMFLRVAQKWLLGGRRGDGSGEFKLDWTEDISDYNRRKMTIVSCNWDNGENFKINFGSVGGVAEVCIDHECLLPTRSYVPPVVVPTEPSTPAGASAADTALGALRFGMGIASGRVSPSSGNLPHTFSATSMVSALSEASGIGEERKGSPARPISRVSKSTSFAEDIELGSSRPASRGAKSRVSSQRDLAAPTPVAIPPLPPKPAYETSEAFLVSVAAAERALSRISASLPKAAVLQLGEGSGLRAFHCSAAASTSAEALPVNEFSDIVERESSIETSWWRRDAEQRVNTPPENVEIVSGPHVVRCTGTSGVVAINAVGRGRVSCSLYEVPAHMQYEDVVAVVSTVDRHKLHAVGVQSFMCSGVGERSLRFTFESLTPYCCYCAVIDPDKHVPATALFRTRGLPTSKVDSIFICPISAADYQNPSIRLGRLARFAAFTRSPASASYCLDYDSAVLRNYVGEEKPHKCDLNFLRKTGTFQFSDPRIGDDGNMHSTLPFLINNPAGATASVDDGSVYVSTHGHFCYISTQNEGSAALRKVIHAVRSLRFEPDVRMLVLMVNQPLIRYLRLRHDGQFVCDGPMNHHKLLCCLLLMTLLDWKSEHDGNDCKIICTAPVSTPKIVLIRYAQHETEAVHPLDRNDDASVATHRDTPVAAAASYPHQQHGEHNSSAVLQEGGDFLEFPSLLEGSLEEPSLFDSLALQSVLLEKKQALGEVSRESLSGGGEVRNLESIYESIGDFSITDLQIQGQLSAILGAGGASQDSKLVDRSVYERDLIAGKAGFVTLEHLILPIEFHSVEGEEVDESMNLPDGKCLIEDIVEYEVLHEFTPEETGVYSISPQLELYRDSLRPEEKIQPVVYRLDFLVHEIHPQLHQQQLHQQQQHQHQYQQGQANIDNGTNMPEILENSLIGSSILSSVLSFNMLHRVYLRPVLSEFDFLELLLGPVVGTVTETTALMLLEFNMNLRQISCVLQPLGAMDENEYIYKSIENIKAFELVEVQFEELLPGICYEIYFPEMFGTKSMGRFKTIQPFLSFAQIAFTSTNAVLRHPITEVLVQQLQHQQSPNLMEIRLLNDLTLEDQKTQRNNNPTDRIIRSGGYENTWAKLGDHLNMPGVHTAAVFHLGGITVLSHFWSALVNSLLDQSRRLEIPLRDASLVGQWYFKQVEQIVKDTFRLFWSTPVVQEVLSHTANVPLFQSQYLLPLSLLEDKEEAARIAGSEEDMILLQLVRRIFETHLQMYMSRLYGWDVNSSTHYFQWRSNSLVTLGIDIVSGRRKIKRKGGEDDDVEVEGAEAAAATATSKSSKAKADKEKKVDSKDPFSLGFLDRGQWKNMRALVQDRTITHIVILTEKPIIPLTRIPPQQYDAPESVEKGEILDWAPTQQDLEVFLKFWFDWLALFQRGEVSSCRSVLLISSCRMPYSTLVQDLKTGLKIQQLCVGEYDRGGALSDIPFHPRELSMSGKLGTIRYVHQFEGQDYYMAQSNGIEKNSNFIERGAENMSSPTAADSSGASLALSKTCGFATLRLWFDSWKALGIWSQEPPEVDITAAKLSAATLLLGPMLGAPTLHTEDPTSGDPVAPFFNVAMMLEVDRPTTLVIQADSVFTDHQLRFELVSLQPRRPYVFEIGPLQLENRYNVRVLSGLKASPHNTFTIDTYIHDNETNILALNCAPLSGEVAGSQIIIEAAKRCAVPFCGITAVLHTNFQPNFERVINEFQYSNSLLELLKEAEQTGVLSQKSRSSLADMIEVFRDQYRTVLSKPSYAEVLRNGFNIMMQNHALFYNEENEPDPSSDLYLIFSLVLLIIARLNQEYFEKWMRPHENVYRAVHPPDPNAAVPAPISTVDHETGEVSLTMPPKPKVKVEWSDPEAAAVDCIFSQWLKGLKPAPYEGTKWVAPNGKVSIEQIHSVNEDNFSLISEQLSASPIDIGTRIIVINQAPSHGDAADPLFLGETDIGVRFQDLLQAWKCRQDSREVCIVCPSDKHGTRKIDVKLTPIEPPPPPPEPEPPIEPLPDGVEPEPVPPPPEPWQIVFKEVYMLDSAYRSNAFQRLQKQSDADRALKESQNAGKKKVAAAAAKSKRAQRQREEEERLRKEEVDREIAEIKANQIPDGYLLIACTTTAIQTSEFTATVSNPPRVSIIGDFVGTEQEKEEMHDDMIDGIPTEYDFIQLPEWFRKFSPSLETMFVRDEVLLLMRQNPESKAILNQIEDGDFIPLVMELYEKSRLSELSRPEDLREIDMTIAGVVPMFFRDLIKKVWDLAVPAEVKPHMFSLSDEFIMSYCFSRALPELTPLTSSLEFARTVQYSLVLSVALKSAQIMAQLDRYAYIIKNPDFPTQKVKAMEDKEKAVVDEKFEAENRRLAGDKAWRLADPQAAEERDRLEQEAAEEAAALLAAQLEISKRDATMAAALAAAKEVEEMRRDVEKTLAVVEVNYDSDLEAINNDEAEDQKKQAAASRLEALKQKEIDHTTMSIKMHASERADRVTAAMTAKEKAAAAEEAAALEAAGGEIDLEAEGMERLDQMRSEWLVAAMEVAMEVVLEKEIYDTIKITSQQLIDECYEEAQQHKLLVSEGDQMAHAKLQVSRLRSETAKSRRVYGKRMSFMA